MADVSMPLSRLTRGDALSLMGRHGRGRLKLTEEALADLRRISLASEPAIVTAHALWSQPGHMQFRPYMRKHLTCIFCDADVYRRGRYITVDESPAKRPHHVIQPGDRHADNCPSPRAHFEQSAGRDYDPDEGYRLQMAGINYDSECSPFERDERNNVTLKDKTLLSRKPKQIAEVDDVAALIRAGNFERLGRSVILGPYSPTPLPWQDFFIRNEGVGNRRWSGLIERTQNHEFQPAVCHIATGGRNDPLGEAVGAAITGSCGGMPIKITPHVCFAADVTLHDVMRRAGEYLVFGQPRSVLREVDGPTHRYDLILAVDRPEQVMMADLRGLAKIGRARAAARILSPAPPEP